MKRTVFPNRLLPYALVAPQVVITAVFFFWPAFDSLRLSLYRVDGAVETVDIGLTLPTRSVAHVVRLLELRLEALTAMQDAGFGFEAIGLAVTRAEPMPARQRELVSPSHPSPANGGGSGWGERAERHGDICAKYRRVTSAMGPVGCRRSEISNCSRAPARSPRELRT